MIVPIRWRIILKKNFEVLVIADSNNSESLDPMMIEAISYIFLSQAYDGMPTQNMEGKNRIDEDQEVSIWFSIKFKNIENSQKYLEALKRLL